MSAMGMYVDIDIKWPSPAALKRSVPLLLLPLLLLLWLLLLLLLLHAV
jgi:hypothetical protein